MGNEFQMGNDEFQTRLSFLRPLLWLSAPPLSVPLLGVRGAHSCLTWRLRFPCYVRRSAFLRRVTPGRAAVCRCTVGCRRPRRRARARDCAAARAPFPVPGDAVPSGLPDTSVLFSRRLLLQPSAGVSAAAETLTAAASGATR